MSRTGYYIISNGSALDTKVGVFRGKALEDLGTGHKVSARVGWRENRKLLDKFDGPS